MNNSQQAVGHAMIIGASAGVGRLVAEALVANGAVVSTVGRSRPPLPDGFHRPSADLSTLDWTQLYADAETAASLAIDAVIYVAGDATFGLAGAVPHDRARRLFEANFWAPINAATAAERLWTEPRHGCFISISSISARRAVPFEAHYCASKAAAARFLDALTLEHPDGRLRFLSVYPGRLRTGFRAKADWYGIRPDGDPGVGSDPKTVADAVVARLSGRFTLPVLGARETVIDWADRVSPAIYDRLVLKRRVRNILKKR